MHQKLKDDRYNLFLCLFNYIILWNKSDHIGLVLINLYISYIFND